MNNLEKPKFYFLVIIFFFFCLFIYSKLSGSIPLSIISTVTNKIDTYSVTGEGKVVTKPDIAYVSIGVEGNGVTVKLAQTQINEVMQKVVNGLKTIGIDTEKDVKTSSYAINPTYDWTSGKQRITGYSADTQLSVKVKDIDKINQVIDSATENGANQINGISFDVEDKEKLEADARKKAVADAKKRAEQAASIAGFKLGKIINYSENANNTPQPATYGRGDLKLAESAVPSTDIQTGSSEIKIIVTLSYQLE
jgi:uncharacterized protein